MQYNSEEERVLVTKGVAGLGNRLLSVLGAIIYCRITKRKLCVDWSDDAYSEDSENVFPLAFECKVGNIDINQVKDDSIYPPIWRGNLDKAVLR